MTFSLSGKCALVSGAGNGIGRAIALAFAQAGAAVACMDLDLKAVAATANDVTTSGGRGLAISGDVSREADTLAAAEAARAAFGPVRILVNGGAGNDPNGSVLEITPEQWDRVFAVHVRGAYLMSRAVLPEMMRAGGGNIIFIASQLGRVGATGRPAYCAAKGALIQLAKAMAADHADRNIRVNTLSPGAVETQRMTARFGDMETARRLAGPKHLVGRLGRPEEIAHAAVFLASDAASFVTGADLLIDGGYTAV
jgi:NAD(P)-dependent dehydrogenase (short-subunit alcohol dehydrogenase family)